MAVLHEPRLDTVLMVEKVILDAEDYLTKMILWRSLPRKVQYQTFRRVLDYLEASGKIVFNSDTIIYVGADNEKLRALMESSVRVR